MQRQIVMLQGKNAGEQRRAQSLAAQLQLPLLADRFERDALVLAFVEDRLELRDASMRPGCGVSITFGRADGRPVRIGSRRREPLARAIGDGSTVLDATAGLGRDSWLLASLGYEVTAVERSPIVAALLANGLERARHSDELDQHAVGRIQIVQGDARQIIADDHHRFDAIYIDPMFPPKRKATALARKSVRLLRELVGDDLDADSLLASARKSAARRVAVKRPDDAPPLGERPAFVVPGKLVRYDVYVTA